ncbi:response regulator [Sulfurimonas sp.]|uniref:response regulator transcription factor n=1 Tax=Sulfurimonas sp. TaxID=2022749 RepID=UPI00262AAF43|nr:response regulator [Sulfurimonas sp.]MCW8895377.1 response regulator [Sulfurimonas sp.]
MDINIVKLKKYASVCSVLYVEDDELIRSQTASFLGRFFPDVVVAEDGAIGLAKYKERSFDVVITDINMPNMNGIEMIEAIKGIKYEQIVLVTSAYNDSEYLMKLINLNVMRFVLKPFNNKQFLYVLYKIAEELTFTKEQAKLQDEIAYISKRAQLIVDQANIGIIVIKDNKLDMANKAFLDIGGFDTFDTLVLEMPEIGVLFEEASHCINAESNSDLIEQLKTLGDEDRKVRIMKDAKTIEYQVTLTKIEDEESYILTFTDITAIHNALFMEEHTKLPAKRFTLEKIEILKQKASSLNVIIMSVNHFDTVEKWYGKQDAIEVETAFANAIKSIRDLIMPDAFIGYFEKNQIIIIPSNNFNRFYEKLKNINMSALNVVKKHAGSDMELELSTKIKLENLDTNKEINQIEVDLINAFDMM